MYVSFIETQTRCQHPNKVYEDYNKGYCNDCGVDLQVVAAQQEAEDLIARYLRR